MCTRTETATRSLLFACWMLTLILPSTALAQRFALPEPELAPVTHREIALSPEEQRVYLDEWRDPPRPNTSGVIRVSLGGFGRFVDGESLGGAFALEAEAGYRDVYRSGFQYQVSVGYGFTDGALTAHLVLAGAGIGFRASAFSVIYMARFTFGAIDERAALGLRHGLLFALWNTIGLSAQHEVLDAEGDQALYQGVLVALTLDIGGIPELFDEE